MSDLIERLKGVQLAMTDHSPTAVAICKEAGAALELAQQLQQITADTVTQQNELLNMHSEHIEVLEAALTQCVDEIEENLEFEGALASFGEAARIGRKALETVGDRKSN